MYKYSILHAVRPNLLGHSNPSLYVNICTCALILLDWAYSEAFRYGYVSPRSTRSILVSPEIDLAADEPIAVW